MSMRSWARVVLIVSLALPVALGCGRFQPARSYAVDRPGDPDVSYRAVREVLREKDYRVVEQPVVEEPVVKEPVVKESAPARTVKVSAHLGEGRPEQQSWITVSVTPDGRVQFVPSGALVKGSTLHKRLAQEVEGVERLVRERLARASSAPSPQAASAPVAVASAANMPRAWNERAYDPKTWGPGEFTCVPVKLAADAQQLGLQLSDGSKADIAISVAYAPGLCRSPAACSLAEGCPALGLGDAQQVANLAERLSHGAITSQATLLQNGQPVANIDLSQHGSVAQALNQLEGSGATPAPAP
jgi:hypothetical protein